MVEELPRFRVVVTPAFAEDFTSAVNYIAYALASPIAARNMRDGIQAKIDALAVMPTASASYTTSRGEVRHKVAYKRYEIHFVIEGTTVRILALKHQLQNSD